jgi:hypothetical protein
MKRGEKLVAAVAAALACGASLATVAYAAPANDNFADREGLSGPLPIAVSGSNVEATKEAGEPSLPFGRGRTIWYEWEAGSTGFISVGTCGTDLRTQIGVYTGTALNGLAAVTDLSSGGPGCDDPTKGSRVTFKAEAGTDYVILVDGDGFYLPPAVPPSGEGPIALQVESTPRPSNDDFDDAALLTGSTHEEPSGSRMYLARREGYNWAATKEPGEPDHGGQPGGASVWYSWTSPETNVAFFSACCGRVWLVHAYTGGSLDTLTTVASGAGFAYVPVVAGTTYRIAVDGWFNPEAGEPAVGAFSFGATILLPSGPGFGVDLPLIPSLQARDTAAPETAVSRSFKKRFPPAVTFGFSANEPAAFHCRLDQRRFVLCEPPKAYKNLKPGRHKFEVFAVDAAGNGDLTPAVSRFWIPKPKPRKPKD